MRALQDLEASRTCQLRRSTEDSLARLSIQSQPPDASMASPDCPSSCDCPSSRETSSRSRVSQDSPMRCDGAPGLGAAVSTHTESPNMHAPRMHADHAYGVGVEELDSRLRLSQGFLAEQAITPELYLNSNATVWLAGEPLCMDGMHSNSGSGAPGPSGAPL